MPSHSKADLAVSALLHNLNEELDRNKRQKVDELLLAKAQGSVRCRLGPRINDRHLQVSHGRTEGQLCGAIFMCNRRTWKECLGQCLFGLPSGKKSLVEQVVPGMKLFLFEYERRQLWGVFDAISYGAMDIIPDAYSGGSFPCQVRVNVPENCVALNEEEFYKVLKDNYYCADKFHFDLTGKQVCHLISLFERKYMRLKGMEHGYIEYKDKEYLPERCNPMRPLLLTEDEALAYHKDPCIKSLPPILYTSKCQFTQGGDFSDSEEGLGFESRDIEKFTRKVGHKTCESSHFVPFPNVPVQHNHLPLDADVSSFTNVGGHLGDIIPVYTTLTNQETIETLVIPGHASGLKSDRPNGKSVWARISGCAKPPVASETVQKKRKLPSNPSHSLLCKAPAESGTTEVDASSVQDDVKDGIVIEDATEEFSVGFKRRRLSSNRASGTASETQTSKRRRKLMRPFFEDSADEPLADQVTTIAESILPVYTNSGNILRNDTLKGYSKEQHASETGGICDLSMVGGTVSEEKSYKTGGYNKKYVIQAMNTEYEPTTLDLNLPLESEVEGFVNSGKQNKYSNATSLGEKSNQEPSSLTLSLPTQETDYLLDRFGKESELTGNARNRSETLVSVWDEKPDNTSHLDNMLVNHMSLLKQVDKAVGEDAEFRNLGNTEQGFEPPQHISSKCTRLELMPAESSRANTHSLASCIPSKKSVGSIDPAISLMGGGKGLAALSQVSMQEMPLNLELGNGAKLQDLKVQLDNNGVSEHVSYTSAKVENCNGATVLGTSNHVSDKWSKAVSSDNISGSTASNVIDLKSILGGLQVSGIKLQLGSSPCLILQLGDSSSSRDKQGQEETIGTPVKASLQGRLQERI